MVYGGIDKQKSAIKNNASLLREAAAMIPKVKAIMERFNGKCYNCKLDNAIRALSEDNPFTRVYARITYGNWYEISAYPKHGSNRDTNLLSAYSAKENNRFMTDETRKIFNDEKRLDAKKAVALLNQRYSELMERAAALDRAAEELGTFLSRIEDLKKTLAAVKNSVPYEVLDICGVNR